MLTLSSNLAQVAGNTWMYGNVLCRLCTVDVFLSRWWQLTYFLSFHPAWGNDLIWLLPWKLTCPLKINGWFRCISYWNRPFFWRHISFRGCNIFQMGWNHRPTDRPGRASLPQHWSTEGRVKMKPMDQTKWEKRGTHGSFIFRGYNYHIFGDVKPSFFHGLLGSKGRWWFQRFVVFTPFFWGEMSILTNICFRWVGNKTPTGLKWRDPGCKVWGGLLGGSSHLISG